MRIVVVVVCSRLFIRVVSPSFLLPSSGLTSYNYISHSIRLLGAPVYPPGRARSVASLDCSHWSTWIWPRNSLLERASRDLVVPHDVAFLLAPARSPPICSHVTHSNAHLLGSSHA